MKRNYCSTMPIYGIIMMLLTVVLCSCHRYAIGIKEGACSQDYRKMDSRRESNESLTSMASMHREQFKTEIVIAKQLLEAMQPLTTYTSLPDESINKGNVIRNLAIGSITTGAIVALIYGGSQLFNWYAPSSAIPSDFHFYSEKFKLRVDLGQQDDFCLPTNSIDGHIRDHIQFCVNQTKELLHRFVLNKEYAHDGRDFRAYAHNLMDRIEDMEDNILSMHQPNATITLFKDLTLNLTEKLKTFYRIAHMEDNIFSTLIHNIWQHLGQHLDWNRWRQCIQSIQTYNSNINNIRVGVDRLFNKMNELNSNLLSQQEKQLWLSNILSIGYLPPLAYFGWQRWKQSSIKKYEILSAEVSALNVQLLADYASLESKSDFREEDQERIIELRTSLLCFVKKLVQVVKLRKQKNNLELNNLLDDLSRKIQALELDINTTSEEQKEILRECSKHIDNMRWSQVALWKAEAGQVKIYP